MTQTNLPGLDLEECLPAWEWESREIWVEASRTHTSWHAAIATSPSAPWPHGRKAPDAFTHRLTNQKSAGAGPIFFCRDVGSGQWDGGRRSALRLIWKGGGLARVRGQVGSYRRVVALLGRGHKPIPPTRWAGCHEETGSCVLATQGVPCGRIHAPQGSDPRPRIIILHYLRPISLRLQANRRGAKRRADEMDDSDRSLLPEAWTELLAILQLGYHYAHIWPNSCFLHWNAIAFGTRWRRQGRSSFISSFNRAEISI
jgi:hypothetical protein